MPAKHGDVDIDRCRSCGGIWLDHRELGLLAKQSTWSLRNLVRSKERVDLNLKKAKCPRHDTPLMRVYSADNPTVVLDSCPTCQGVWLDGGELEKLL